MKPLYYLIKKSFKNTLKELRRKPLTLVFYIIIAFFLCLIIGISFFRPSKSIPLGRSINSLKSIITALLFIIGYSSLKNSIENGSSFFRMSDVNLTFTAPIKPKRILIYGFIKQMTATIFTMIFFIFQMPNLKINFGISGLSMLIMLISLFALFVVLPILGILIYGFASKSAKNRSTARFILNSCVYLLGGLVLFNLIQSNDILKTLSSILSSDLLNYIPVLGWFRAIIVSTFEGYGPVFFYNICLIIAFFALLVNLFTRMNPDYYEDVLEATEYKESLYTAKKEGRNPENLQKRKLKKVRSKYTGSGAKAIFNRHMMEYKKTGFFLVNRTTLFMIIFGLASKFFYSKGSINTVLYMTIYILFFLSFQGKWLQETKKPYIYLIPANSASKLFYATLADNLKNLIDGCCIFLVAGLVFKADSLTILLCILIYTTFGSLFIYTDVLGRRLFGEIHGKILSSILAILLVIFVITPGIVVSIIIQIKFSQVSFIQYYSYLIMLGWNTLMALGILVSSRGVFKNIEME